MSTCSISGAYLLRRAWIYFFRLFLASICGEGSSSRARARGCEAPSRSRTERPFCRIRGHVDHDEARDLLCRSRLLVVPSRSEPQGVVVLEALASGTPVIGSNVGGIPDMIRDGENGWLVRPQNSDDLRRAILKAFHDPAKLDDIRTLARQSVKGYSLQELGGSITAAYIS